MKKEFIPYEQALELKELGFDEPCFGWFDTGYLRVGNVEPKHIQGLGEILAPLYQQAFRWFREKGFHCAIMPKITPSNSVVYYMYEGKPKKNWDNCFKTYEEAELACLNKLIEIVKNGK